MHTKASHIQNRDVSDIWIGLFKLIHFRFKILANIVFIVWHVNKRWYVKFAYLSFTAVIGHGFLYIKWLFKFKIGYKFGLDITFLKHVTMWLLIVSYKTIYGQGWKTKICNGSFSI